MQEFFRFELGQTEEEAFVSLGLRDVLGDKDMDLIDLLGKMFCYDPEVRISAEEALMHKYFDEVWEGKWRVNGERIPCLLDFTMEEIDGYGKLFPKPVSSVGSEKKSFVVEGTPYKVYTDKWHYSMKNTGFVSTNMSEAGFGSPMDSATKDL